MDWVKWTVIVMMEMLSLLTIPGAGAQAFSIHRSPENLTVDFALRENVTEQNVSVDVLLTSSEAEIIDNIAFVSPYVVDYVPRGGRLEPSVETAFTLIFSVGKLTENATIYGTAVVIGDTESGTVNLTEVPFQLNVDAQVIPLKIYIYNKCFIEDDETFCTEVHLEELQNITVTVINVTEENNTFNVMMPFETTKEFFLRYDRSLNKTVEEMSRVAQAVMEQTNKTMQLQEREEQSYRNALFLENYMKKEDNPTYFEISPNNLLLNSTGMELEAFEDALNVLFEMGKIVQRDEDTWQTTPLPNGGVLTMPLKKTFVGSTDRVHQEKITGTSLLMVGLAVSAVIAALTLVSLYEFRWKKNYRWQS